MKETRWVWLVIGETGEYSDHTQWSVAVYDNEEMAKEHVRLVKVYLSGYPKSGDYEEQREYLARNPYDPNCSIAYYGGDVEYSVEKLPLVCHVDEYQELGLTRGSPHDQRTS